MDELTAAQEEELARTLARLEGELEEALVRSADGARPVDLDQPIGRVSRVDALQQQAMVAAGRRSVERRLALVRRARLALTNGEYGFCKRCEEPVGYRRLALRPETLLCVACQAESER